MTVFLKLVNACKSVFNQLPDSAESQLEGIAQLAYRKSRSLCQRLLLLIFKYPSVVLFPSALPPSASTRKRSLNPPAFSGVRG